MISVLAQERLLGAALGSILTGVVIFEHRRTIYNSISQSQPQASVDTREILRFFVHNVDCISGILRSSLDAYYAVVFVVALCAV